MSPPLPVSREDGRLEGAIDEETAATPFLASLARFLEDLSPPPAAAACAGSEERAATTDGWEAETEAWPPPAATTGEGGWGAGVATNAECGWAGAERGGLSRWAVWRGLCGGAGATWRCRRFEASHKSTIRWSTTKLAHVGRRPIRIQSSQSLRHWGAGSPARLSPHS